MAALLIADAAIPRRAGQQDVFSAPGDPPTVRRPRIKEAKVAEMQEGPRRCGIRAGRLGALVASLALAAGLCGAAAQSDSDRGYATQPFTPQNFQMPQGEGCAGDVARWKAVQDNDYASGNIGLKVYHQIAGEIERADAACRAGHDGEASRIVHDSRRRHGYPG